MKILTHYNKQYPNGFNLVTETNTEFFNDYMDAFRSYQSSKESATLYGYDELGEMSVIFSK